MQLDSSVVNENTIWIVSETSVTVSPFSLRIDSMDEDASLEF